MLLCFFVKRESIFCSHPHFARTFPALSVNYLFWVLTTLLDVDVCCRFAFVPITSFDVNTNFFRDCLELNIFYWQDDKKKKKSNRIVELPIIGRTHGFSQAEFDRFFELEVCCYRLN